MEIAVLDLGSTTFHLEHIRVDEAGRFSSGLDTKRSLCLGAQVFSDGFIDRRSWLECLDAVYVLLEASDACRPDHRVIVATSAIRSAANGMDLVREIERRHRTRVQILDPQEEARLAHLGQSTSPLIGGRRVLVVDLGGGSVELAIGEGTRCLQATSLPIGAVRMRATSVGPVYDRRAATALAQVVRPRLLPALSAARDLEPEIVVFGSGSARAARKLLMRDSAQPGKVGPIELSELRYALDRHLGASIEDLIDLGVEPARASTVLVSATIIVQIMDLLGITHANVSDKGLRDGVALEVFREQLLRRRAGHLTAVA
jgi:exopolyphosphatase/guanosine-5'-triphosphate,3'-diphosphate pyrophosphatase